MQSWKPTIFFIGGIILAFIIVSCSPSSSSTRYNQAGKKKNEPGDTKNVRFTSENDTNPKESSDKEKNIITYANVPEEGLPKEEYPVDVSGLIKKHKRIKELGGVLTDREKMLFEILNYIDTPYQYGGNNKNGIDCSAFTQNVFGKTLNKKIPRTASEQFSVGNIVRSESDLSFGDLIFFNTTTRSYPGHVGIYIGDDLFAHSSQSKGVTISSLKNNYYSQRFVGGRRVGSFD